MNETKSYYQRRSELIRKLAGECRDLKDRLEETKHRGTVFYETSQRLERERDAALARCTALEQEIQQLRQAARALFALAFK